MGWPSSIAGVAEAYRDFLDVLVVDNADQDAVNALRRDGLRVLCTNTIMRSADEKRELGAFIVNSAGESRIAAAST